MGFSFNRASQAGGKIVREVSTRIRGTRIAPFFPGDSPTSPLDIYYDNTFAIGYSIFDGFTYTSAEGGPLSFTFGSNYWIDLVGIVAYTPTNAYFTFSINGLSKTPPINNEVENGIPGFYFDVYGYGCSGYIGYEGSLGDFDDLYAFPLIARTFITENGSVQYPTAYAGRSVARDFPKP